MVSERLFIDAELKELSTGFMDLALEALDKGDIEKAKHWCKKNEETKHLIHDIYLFWVPALLSYIYDHLGEDGAVRALKETVRHWIEPFVKVKQQMIQEKGIRTYVEAMADLWRQHCGNFTLEEDDEKIIFRHKPCGSGGRLTNMKAFDGPTGYRRLRKAGPHTWDIEGVPIYCAHCPWAHEIWPLALAGEGAQLWIHASPHPKEPGDECVHYIYKDPQQIPDKYYERIKMERSPKTLGHP